MNLPRPRRPGLKMSMAERARLLAMVLGMLVCLAMIVVPNPFGGTPEKEGPSTADIPLEGDVWHMPVEMSLIQPESTGARTERVAETLAEIEDLTATLHPKPYALLLQMAARTPPESVKVVPSEDPYPAFVDRPATMRGQLVRIVGRLGAMRGDLAPKEVQALCGIKKVYSGLILDGAGHGIQFKVVEKRQDFIYGRDNGDPVQLIGYFYKNWAYEKDDGQTARMPLVIGYTVEDLPMPADSQFQAKLWQFGIAVLGLGFLLLAIVFTVSRRADRASEAADARRRKNRLKRALDKTKPSSPAEPSATPEPSAAQAADSGLPTQESPEEQVRALSPDTPGSAPSP